MDGFSAKGFCIDPQHWGMQGGLFVQAMKDAAEMAKDVDDICIAIVKDKVLDEFALAEPGKEWDKKFILFNAEEAKPLSKGAIRVYTYDASTRKTLLKKWIRYKPGSKI